MSESRTLCCRSVAETRDAGRHFASRLEGEETVLLFGDLGSGKTVFTQGMAIGLGMAADQVQSPTYTLIQEYATAGQADPVLVHIDLYRLSPDAVESIGLDEALAGPGVKVVEWADRLTRRPDDAWMITIEQAGSDERRISIRREKG